MRTTPYYTIYSIPFPLERALLSIQLEIKILDLKKRNSSINRLGLLRTRSDLHGSVGDGM